jgi:RNA polymerase sigma-70 factor (ECF subfamily)
VDDQAREGGRKGASPDDAIPAGRNLEDESTFRLMVQAREGEPDAVERLCRRFLPRLRRWAAGRLPRGARDLVDTDDVVQDVLVHAIAHLAHIDYRQEHALQAYARRMLKNRITDEIRRATRTPGRSALDAERPGGWPSPFEELVGRETVRAYESALERLEPLEREAVVARIELGSSYEEVADAVGKPSADAARKAVSRALVKLATEMTSDD